MKWRLTGAIMVAVLSGAALGIGAYTFIYAKGASYLTDEPAACANCHIMREHYDRWIRSSHHAVATCNDCHTPSGLLAKYATKASNGFRHSLAFTTGWFSDPLQIKPYNVKITEQACEKCHQNIMEATERSRYPRWEHFCIRCHRSVGHP